jgi:hypothetical protein
VSPFHRQRVPFDTLLVALPSAPSRPAEWRRSWCRTWVPHVMVDAFCLFRVVCALEGAAKSNAFCYLIDSNIDIHHWGHAAGLCVSTSVGNRTKRTQKKKLGEL